MNQLHDNSQRRRSMKRKSAHQHHQPKAHATSSSSSNKKAKKVDLDGWVTELVKTCEQDGVIHLHKPKVNKNKNQGTNSTKNLRNARHSPGEQVINQNQRSLSHPARTGRGTNEPLPTLENSSAKSLHQRNRTNQSNYSRPPTTVVPSMNNKNQEKSLHSSSTSTTGSTSSSSHTTKTKRKHQLLLDLLSQQILQSCSGYQTNKDSTNQLGTGVMSSSNRTANIKKAPRRQRRNVAGVGQEDQDGCMNTSFTSSDQLSTIQPRRRDYGGMGYARPSIYLSWSDPSFIPKWKEEFQQHIPGFRTRVIRKIHKKQINQTMLWRQLRDPIVSKQLLQQMAHHQAVGVVGHKKGDKKHSNSMKQLEQLTSNERIEAILKANIQL